MTERYTGWKWPEQDAEERDVEMQAHLERSTSYPSSSFTAINHPRKNVPQHSSHSSANAHDYHDQNRHPQLLAQYLGLGDEYASSARFDRLASVDTAPPSSLSEQYIHKRKRAGERSAKEVKKAAKRAKIISDETLEAPHNVRDEMPARKSNVARRRASAATERVPKDLPVEGQATSIPPSAHSIPDISLSQKTISKLSTWKYDSPRAPSSSVDGVVSLVAPLTSMDLIQKSRGALVPERELAAAEVTARPQPSFNHHVASYSQQRRAPSTGQPLEAIPEEPSKASTPKIQPSGRSAHHSERPSSHAGSTLLSNPIFPSSPSLISTSTESFPPVQRRHQIVECETIPPIPLSSDDFDSFVELDDDDLLGIECDHIHDSEIHALDAATAKFSTGTANEQLPTPQTSDGEPIPDDNMFDTLDDDDEWLQLPDVAPEFIDLTGSDPAQPTSCTALGSNSLGLSCPSDAGEKTPISGPINDLIFALDQQSDNAEALDPFARPDFPKAIQDRSPLLNITNSLVLRTCFRIGEAINVGAHYARQSPIFTSDGILIELYARVLSSHRLVSHAGVRQNFVFADLWSEKAPRLVGEWASWKGSRVFEEDARKLLTDVDDVEVPKMCRIVGKMKRENEEWKFLVLSAWECGWDDVQCARGLVCSG